MSLKKLLLIIVALIIFVLLFLNWQNKNHNVSPKTSILKNKSFTSPITIKKSATIESNNIINKIKNGSKESTESLNDLTYLKLYKMNALAGDCQPLFEISEEIISIEILNEFVDYLPLISKNRQQIPTKIQSKKLEKFINDCNDLKVQTKKFKKTINQFNRSYLQDSIKLRMQKTIALTQEEKNLKQVIKLIEEIKAKGFNLNELTLGEYSIDFTKVQQLNFSINELKTKLRQLYRENNNNIYTDNYKSLLETLRDEQDYLESLHSVNNKQISALFWKHNEQILQLIPYLNTKYATVFYEAHKQMMEVDIFYEYLISKESSPINDKLPLIKNIIAKQLDIKDKRYYDTVYQNAIDLYTCYLGADCSTDSSLIRNFCFGINAFNLGESKNIIYHEACGLTVEEFYLKHFLSSNQIEDTNRIFEYLINNYAK